MIWHKLNAKSVVLLHECIYRDIYDTHQLRVIMTRNLRPKPSSMVLSFKPSRIMKHALIQLTYLAL